MMIEDVIRRQVKDDVFIQNYGWLLDSDLEPSEDELKMAREGSRINSFRGEYFFLSNFYKAPFVLWGYTFPTDEHAYQSAKTFDEDYREKILGSDSPARAKKIGRELPVRKDWDQVKIPMMLAVVYYKFAQNPVLMDRLLDTGDIYLEEGNDWGDRFWGTVNGEGENHLGKIIMCVRRTLREWKES